MQGADAFSRCLQVHRRDEYIPHYSIIQLTYFLKWHVEYFLMSLEPDSEIAGEKKIKVQSQIRYSLLSLD